MTDKLTTYVLSIFQQHAAEYFPCQQCGAACRVGGMTCPSCRTYNPIFRRDSDECEVGSEAALSEQAEKAAVLSLTGEPDEDGMIPWVGGECPVEAGVMVRIRLRDGHICEYTGTAVGWQHTGRRHDVVAYCVPHKGE